MSAGDPREYLADAPNFQRYFAPQSRQPCLHFFLNSWRRLSDRPSWILFPRPPTYRLILLFSLLISSPLSASKEVNLFDRESLITCLKLCCSASQYGFHGLGSLRAIGFRETLEPSWPGDTQNIKLCAKEVRSPTSGNTCLCCWSVCVRVDDP